MSVIQELIRLESNGTISFGNYEMDEKKKVVDFDVNGDLYNVKTFAEITRLEKNGKFIYESVPGSTVHNFKMDDKEVSFAAEGKEDLQITIELEAEKEYKMLVDDMLVGKIKANLSGKVSFSVEMARGSHNVKIEKIG
ncbi:MAG: endosialidase [Lachnospiraceae bacterium]|nr:endosialidase [Lachnospiraceae bacterium]